jgi:hypothetical protein
MNKTLQIALIVILAHAPFSSGETTPSHIKTEEIASLQQITMLFDGGSIQFRFELLSGSTLEVILNDHEQMGGWLRGVPEQSARDWWLWLVKDRVTHFLNPDKSENYEIENMLATFLKQHSDIDNHTRQELLELKAIINDRKRTKVSYNFWTGFRKDIGK